MFSYGLELVFKVGLELGLDLGLGLLGLFEDLSRF